MLGDFTHSSSPHVSDVLPCNPRASEQDDGCTELASPKTADSTILFDNAVAGLGQVIDSKNWSDAHAEKIRRWLGGEE